MRTLKHLACLLFAVTFASCGRSAKPGAPPPSSQQPTAATLDTRPPTGDARRRVQRAIHAMDAGQVERALELLTQVRTELPHNAIVLHELALAYRLHREPKKAVELLGPFRDQLPAEMLAGYGSALDETGDKRSAEAVLRQGVEKYPTSGLLHSDLGTLLNNSGRVSQAIEQYEQGIQAEPQAQANYYNAAQLLSSGPRRGMSLIYGEIFRLLEPESPRSQRIAELMVKTLQAAVRIEKEGDKTHTIIALAPNAVDLAKTPLAGVPFENAFELTFGLALAKSFANGYSLRALHEARAMFLPMLREPEAPRSLLGQPLLRWLVALESAGHLEAYDVWLFGPGFPDEARAWLSQREATARLSAMAKYIVSHPLYPKASYGDPDTI